MNGDSLHETGLYKHPLVEQAMRWLVENGPLVDEPELPYWILRQLVAQQRVLRLRRGLYLVPHADGKLPSFPSLVGLLSHEGHLSFYAALILHGLTDQDTRTWVVVTSKRQSPINYGPRQMRFFASPRGERAHTTVVDAHGTKVRVATGEQAFIDTLAFPHHGPDFSEMLHILRAGLITGRLSNNCLRDLAIREDSPALARRLGFLMELATDRVDEELLRLAHRTHDRTQAWPGEVKATDDRWRISLPASRELIAYGARL